MIFSSLKQKSVADFVIGSGHYLLFDKIEKIAQEWDAFTSDDLYYFSEYLKIIEDSPSLGIRPFYLIELEQNTIVSVFYYQLKSFKLDESMSGNAGINSNPIKKHISKLVRFSTLVNGNLLLTGKYGYYNLDKQIISISNIEKVNSIVCEQITHITKSKPQGFLVKDFYETEIEDINYKGGFTPCVVHPNMIMEIDGRWNNFDDYLFALNTKYRTRVKRAEKKLNGVTFKEMSLDEVIEYNEKINELYKNIALNADFNLFILPDDYFTRLKQVFKDNLIIKGCFLEKELVGFFTCLYNYGHLDAHFLGYDLNVNAQNQLYLNMLLNMIKLGIEKQCVRIFMSRTAIEIKNSVGAFPHEMLCYFRYNNAIINPLVKPIFDYYKPQKTYILRSPFKNSESTVLKDNIEEENCGLTKILCKK